MITKSQIDQLTSALDFIVYFCGDFHIDRSGSCTLEIPKIDPENGDILDWYYAPINGDLKEALHRLCAPVIGLTAIDFAKRKDGTYSLQMFAEEHVAESLVPGVADAINIALAREERRKSLPNIRSAMEHWVDEGTWSASDVVEIAGLMGRIARDHLQMDASANTVDLAVHRALDALRADLAHCLPLAGPTRP